MSYENANRYSYLFPAADAGAATVTKKIQGPKGKKGRVIDWGFVNVTEAFTADTTGCDVSVGKTGALAAYGAALPMGTQAIGGGKTMRSTYSGADIDTYVVADIPADTEVFLTATLPTGGVPAGIGDLLLIIDWDW